MHNIYILMVSLAASLAAFTFFPACAAGPSGFLSLNCGGPNYTDANTSLGWVSDDNYTGHGKTAKVEVPLENVSAPLQTLRFFPGGDQNNKYCYSLSGLSEGTTYLIRASFLYGNYDGKNRPPSFVLILNYDIWSNVSSPAGSATEPTVYEITYVSSSDQAVVCLARHQLEISETPFISTLELRPLDDTMYGRGVLLGGALDSGYGLHLAHRVNYGAKTSEAVRYPNDAYDRIWVANTTGPILSINSDEISQNTSLDREKPPSLVMATAITTKGVRNLSVVFEDFGGVGGFFIRCHFARLSNSTPLFNLTISQSLREAEPIPVTYLRGFGIPMGVKIELKASLLSPFVATLVPDENSTIGPLLNAIELLQWSENPLQTNSTLPADLKTIRNLQKAFHLMNYGDGDPCLPQDYSWTWVVCNADSEPRIIEIHLTNFGLSGEISEYINNLSALQKIYLADNKLTGLIPNLTALTSLQVLDLHNNELNGHIPSSLEQLSKLTLLNLDDNTDLCGTIPRLLLEKSVNLTYSGDSNLCNDTQCTCPSTSSMTALSTKKCSIKKYIYIISTLAFVYVISMLGMFILQKNVRDKRSNISTEANKEGDNVMKEIPFTIQNLSYEEVAHATTQFSTKIGEGGFGQVFHGVLRSGQVVAIKTLADASRQGLKQFVTEVSILSRLHHKNLVCLVGYCTEKTYMLIYEYIPKGNLRDLLYGEVESNDKPLPWRIRLRIALDAAQGLEYLHMNCEPAIIHRDVKSSNILLNDKMQAKVADFGLSRLKEGDSTVSHVSTVNVVGTAGYLDPAYNTTNQLTDKSDVYSFGVMLFELICGRPPINADSISAHIVDWVTPILLQGNIGDIVDPVLTKGYKLESMWKVIDLAFGCVESDRSKRPTMIEVVHVLRKAVKIEIEYTPRSEDVSASSSTSEGKLPILRYIESLKLKLEPR